MAEDRIEARELSYRRLLPWTDIFRCFQVALDPKKLVVAAAGILAMAAGWSVISWLFWAASGNAPDTFKNDYTDPGGREVQAYVTRGRSPEEAQRLAQADYNLLAYRYGLLRETAAPGGRFNNLPWNEDRGPNPFLTVTGRGRDWTPGKQAFVVLEPLWRFVEPVAYLISPRQNWFTRLYFALVVAWTLAVWSFFGGVITRMAALQLAGKEQVGFLDSVKFVASRYPAYLLSPLVPLAFVGVAVVVLALVVGTINTIPYLGDLIVSLTWPLTLAGGAVMAILLLGLLAYPLMYPTISAEGSDQFDAIQRSFAYFYQGFWYYVWNGLVAVAYGAVLIFLVGLVTSLAVYQAKWGVSVNALQDYFGRSPEFLFVYAPESFGWRELLLQNSPAVDEAGRLTPAGYDAYVSTLWSNNKFAAGVTSVWLWLVFLVMLGFGYSYFWTAATSVYLLMRQQVDDTELDEVYLEDEDLDPLLPPAPPASVAAPPPPGGTALPVVDAPPPSPPPPPLPPAAVEPPPAKPAPEPAKPAGGNGAAEPGSSAAKPGGS